MPYNRQISRRDPGHVFSRAPQATIPRSSFDRSHGVKTTFSAGYLVPILVDEMLPGDTFNVKLHAFARMSTMLFPVMDNLYLETFYFFVPNRLLWQHWEAFNGARTGPSDPTTADTYSIPTITSAAGVGEATLGDYFGLPTKIAGLSFNSLPFRAYNLTYNTWFKDENLQDDVVVDVDDGPDTEGDYVLLRRGKRRDYFTSCLPWPQKNAGGAVELPLGDTAPLQFTSTANAGIFRITPSAGTDSGTSYTVQMTAGDSQRLKYGGGVDVNAAPQVAKLHSDFLLGTEVDLSAATSATINDIRLAFQTQKLYERDARGGTRYTEIIRSHFGVISPDARLQRPEYLGGSSTPIIINPIAQTSATSGSDALGDLAAYGVVAPQPTGFVYSATEHGYILGLVSVRADLNYQQGMSRLWNRRTRLEFYWPVFAHLGEQAVLNKEIYAQATADDNLVFGYQEHWAEYRYKPSQVTGLFRSNATGTLDSWHLAQDFAALPVLGSTFIQETPPMSRVKAVTTEPDFFFDGHFVMHCARPMPVYSVPGLVDHF